LDADSHTTVERVIAGGNPVKVTRVYITAAGLTELEL
jgi:hypothetical protein